MTEYELTFSADAEFPHRRNGMMHLNHSGVAPIPHRAMRAMMAYAAEACMEQGLTNPRWYARLEQARQRAASLIGASPAEVAFTKNTTHGLIITAQSINWKAGDVIVVEEGTFPANWYTWKTMEKTLGVRVVTLPEKKYRYRLEDLEKILKKEPVRLVSLSAVDYATGFRHDLAAAGRMVKDAGALFCVDAIQALGAIEFDVDTVRADFVSADGHKWLLGPEGAALYYVRKEVLKGLNEHMTGWIGRKNFMDFEARDLPAQPGTRRFEEGAYNHAGIQGFSAALSLFLDAGMANVESRLLGNVRHLRAGMKSIGWKLMSPDGEGEVAGISSFAHKSLDPEKVAEALRARGVICFPRRGWLRLAPHFYQSVEEMDEAVAAVAEVSSALSA